MLRKACHEASTSFLLVSAIEVKAEGNFPKRRLIEMKIQNNMKRQHTRVWSRPCLLGTLAIDWKDEAEGNLCFPVLSGVCYISFAADNWSHAKLRRRLRLQTAVRKAFVLLVGRIETRFGIVKYTDLKGTSLFGSGINMWISNFEAPPRKKQFTPGIGPEYPLRKVGRETYEPTLRLHST